MLLLLFVVGVIAVALIARRRRGHRVTEPVCGQCGYRVQGLPTFTCPECGADLREVGIETPQHARPLGPLSRGLLWTLILPIPALLVTCIPAAPLLPRRAQQTQTISLGQPLSRAYRTLCLYADGNFTVWPWQLGRVPTLQRVHVILVPPAAQVPAVLDVDLASMTYQLSKLEPKGPRVVAVGSLDLPALNDWFAANGVDTADPCVPVEAEAVLSVIQGARAGNMVPPRGNCFLEVSVGSGSASTLIPAVWAPPVLGFWVLVWLAGLWMCVRRRRPALRA